MEPIIRTNIDHIAKPPSIKNCLYIYINLIQSILL